MARGREAGAAAAIRTEDRPASMVGPAVVPVAAKGELVLREPLAARVASRVPETVGLVEMPVALGAALRNPAQSSVRLNTAHQYCSTPRRLAQTCQQPCVTSPC